MAEFSSSPESKALARLKELHRTEPVPADFRERVAERLARLEAPAPKLMLWRRAGTGLLLLAAAAAVVFAVRSDHTRVTPLPEQAAAPRTTGPSLKAGRIAVSGRMAPDVIRAVMRGELGRFRECYEALPQPRPVVESTLNFKIGSAGNVTGHVESEASPVLGQCLERVLLAIRFPAPTAGDVTVAYSILFEP